MSDLDELVSLSHQLHSEGVFADLPFSPERAKAYIQRVAHAKHNETGFVAIRSQEMVGFINCLVGNYFVCEDTKIMNIQNFYVKRELRHTLHGGRVSLALFRGASRVVFSVGSGIELTRSHQLAKKLGMVFSGGNYVGKM
jgi:hypothetical protein